MAALIFAALLAVGAFVPASAASAEVLPTIDDVLQDLESDKGARDMLKSEVYTKQVTDLYKQVNPEKVGSVPAMMKKYFGREEFLWAALTDKYPWGAEGKDVTHLIFSAEDAKKAEANEISTMPGLPAAVRKRKTKNGLLLFYYAKSHTLVRQHFSNLATASLGKIDCFAMDCNHERNNKYCVSDLFEDMGMRLVLLGDPVKGKEKASAEYKDKFTAKDMAKFAEELTGVKIGLN